MIMDSTRVVSRPGTPPPLENEFDAEFCKLCSHPMFSYSLSLSVLSTTEEFPDLPRILEVSHKFDLGSLNSNIEVKKYPSSSSYIAIHDQPELLRRSSIPQRISSSGLRTSAPEELKGPREDAIWEAPSFPSSSLLPLFPTNIQVFHTLSQFIHFFHFSHFIVFSRIFLWFSFTFTKFSFNFTYIHFAYLSLSAHSPLHLYHLLFTYTAVSCLHSH